MQTIALLGGGGGIKVWKFWVTSACPRTVQREMFVEVTHASPLTSWMSRKGRGMRGTPKNAVRFLGTPTRPYATLYIDLMRRVVEDALGVCCAGESTNVTHAFQPSGLPIIHADEEYSRVQVLIRKVLSAWLAKHTSDHLLDLHVRSHALSMYAKQHCGSSHPSWRLRLKMMWR